jgi:hypothetical protein
MPYIRKGASKILKENPYVKTEGIKEAGIDRGSFPAWGQRGPMPWQSKKEKVESLFNNWELNFIKAERYLLP